MKLSKILMTVAAAAALVGFAGCGAGDDDPNNMIKGSGKNYSIDYTNEEAVISRGYEPTAYAHAGAAVQIDIENVTNDTLKSGVMGFIFDLETTDKATNKRNFNVIGVRANDTNGKLGFYVSRFENVTDIQADNFGATVGAKDGEAKEIEYVKAFGNAQGLFDNGTTTVYAYAIEKKMNGAGTDDNGTAYADGDYVYKVYLLNDKVGKLDINGNLVTEDGKNTIDLTDVPPLATIAVPRESGKEDKVPSDPIQRKLAVYANVYPTKQALKEAGLTDAQINDKAYGCGTLKGKWTYRGDYKYVGVEED